MKTISYYNSPIGKILLASDEQGLVGLWLDTDRYYGDILAKNYSEGENEYLVSAKKWLDIYFQGKEPTFTPQFLTKNSLWNNYNLQKNRCPSS